MYCNKCTTEIQGDYKYCPVCGAEIHNPTIKNKRIVCFKYKSVIFAIVTAILITGIIFSVYHIADIPKKHNGNNENIIYADHSVAESVAYDYVASILLADNPSDYESFADSTTIDWDALFKKLNENNSIGNPQDVYLDFFSDNIIFGSMPDGYDYFKTKTISVTDYAYTDLHKNITMFGKLFRPLSLSPVSYIPFSEIRTLNSVVLSVEFYDADDNLITTEQLDITVVAESDEYYSPRDYSVLYDNFFMEKFITSLYPEETSTAFHK